VGKLVDSSCEGVNAEMTPTEARDLAGVLAKSDTVAALQVAHEIPDAWFRAQALAWISRYAEGESCRAIASSARLASQAAEDPYQTVGSAAWWVRALIERGASESASAEIPALLEAARSIAHPVSRIDALYLLFQAVFEVGPARQLVLDALLEAGAAARSWKAGDRLREAAVMLHRDFPEQAARVIAAMPEGKYKRQAVRRTSATCKTFRGPRPFFW
jgi:hypothetical protein